MYSTSTNGVTAVAGLGVVARGANGEGGDIAINPLFRLHVNSKIFYTRVHATYIYTRTVYNTIRTYVHGYCYDENRVIMHL